MTSFVLVMLGGLLAAISIYAFRKYIAYRISERTNKARDEKAQCDLKECQVRSASVGESNTRSALAAAAALANSPHAALHTGH